jgi:peptidoglycan/LPS O-acetylase OafA/YrhL
VPSEPKALGQPVSLYQFYILIFVPPLRLVDFVLGMIMCQLVIRKQWPQISWTWVLGLFAVGWVLSWTLPAPLGFVAPMVIPNVLLIGKAAMNDLHNIPSFLTRPSVVWLGDVSFAFYLTHWLVLHYGRVFLGGGPWNTPVATLFEVGALVVALALAELLRRNIELPAMKRWSRPKPRPVTEPVSVAGVTTGGRPTAVD